MTTGNAAVTGPIVTGREPTGRAIVPLAPGGDVTQYARDHYLPPGAKAMILRGIPRNTLLAYTKAWQRFRTWCEQRRRTHAPCSADTMVAYFHEWEYLPIHLGCKGGRQANGDPCAGHRPSPSTMWIAYSAVRFYHGVGSPPLPWEGGENLSRAMIAYSEEMVQKGWEPRQAPRAYPLDVSKMVDALDLSTPKHLRDRAIILTAFYTAARASDLGTYRIGDVDPFAHGLELTLRMSKTNRRVGKKIEKRMLFAVDDDPQYCAVEAVRAWMGWLRTQGINHGALFRPFAKPGKNGPGTLLRGHRDESDYRMSGTSLTNVVQEAALRAKVMKADEFTVHSLRRGRATQQREDGVDPLDIARAYGWVPGGAINVYLEEADRQSPTAPGAIGLLRSLTRKDPP